MKQLLINTESLETRIALAQDGKLTEYFVERKDGDRKSTRLNSSHYS